ncbi:MAG: hybrid sensor histidine kinase/response regulator [Roseovarius sp.]
MTDHGPETGRNENSGDAESRANWRLGPGPSLWVLGLAALLLLDPSSAGMPSRFLFPLATIAASLSLLSLDKHGGRLGRPLAVTAILVAIAAVAPPLVWPGLHGAATGSPLALPALVISLGAVLGASGVLLVTRLRLFRPRLSGMGPAVLQRPEGVLAVFVFIAVGILAAVMLVGRMGLMEIGDTGDLAGHAALAAALALLIFQLAHHAFDPHGSRGRIYQVAAVAMGAGVVLLNPYSDVVVTPVAALVAVTVVCILYGLFRTALVAWAGLVVVAMATPGLTGLIATSQSEIAEPVAGLTPFIASAALVVIALLNSRTIAAQDMLLTGRKLSRMRARLGRHGAGRLLQADLEHKLIRSVDAERGERSALGFAEFFSGSRSTDLLKLVDAMNRKDGEVFDRPFSLDLNSDPFGSRRADAAGAPEPHHVHLLGKSGSMVWLGVINLASNSDLVRRAEAAEEALAEMQLREERLLSVAAHEMRTPMSILSMLSEELDAGTPWSEVAPSFRKANGRITEILDDLRVRSHGDNIQLLKTKFTLREMAFHLQETYTGPAQANGIALILALSQQGDTLIESDYGRVFIALSKLVHNAIIHSRGTEITISAFLTRQSGGGAIITWQVSDDGRGISPERTKTVFRPFDTDGRNEGEDRTGLGLYTAQRAIRAMGGELSLRKTSEFGIVPRRMPRFSMSPKEEEGDTTVSGPGATFVLKHPARLAKHSKYATMEHDPVTETQVVYPGKSALLVEDNQIVGDITLARMRRLFEKSIWAERADEALIAFSEHRPDLLLVDQLLPGMLGSEFIRQIRQVDKKIPIVGITASTMGTECAELEAAGANFALEKPLSVQQLQKIAREFFGAAVDVNEGQKTGN